MAVLQLLVALFTILTMVRGECLHNGCEMTEGLPADEVDKRVNSLLNSREYLDNVLKVATWNINEPFGAGKWETSDKDVCSFLKNMQPLVS